ncbi:hypothetical protein [Chromatium okenii]|uniref:hypothetical protein n=1 Tax=Chromatium okenii TaxID=61644 RepID=UPI0011B0DA68|nr:hypothetical protein [Chromatium okenii]
MSFDQTFFERFKQNFNADVALQVIDKNGFKPFAGTIDGGSAFTAEQLQSGITGEVLLRQLDYQGIRQWLTGASSMISLANRSAFWNCSLIAVRQ